MLQQVLANVWWNSIPMCVHQCVISIGFAHSCLIQTLNQRGTTLTFLA